jgi:hypothetical protein
VGAVGERKRFRKLRTRLNESDESRLATELRAWAAKIPGTTPISDGKVRERARFAGVVRRITVRPVHGFDALEVELYDGSGELAVLWLGRRTIPGLTLASRLVVEGVLGMDRDRRRVVNPTFEFLSVVDA